MVGTDRCAGGVAAGGKLELTSEVVVEHPKLWNPEHPHLYTVETTVSVEGTIVDVCDTRCGIRSIRFDPDEGFFLNEEPVKLRGVNEHHDAGCLGAAVPDDVLRRRLAILKAMGCNAIRIAHNPASPVFLDLCDEMGFMVVEDAFDEWKAGKTEYGYHLYWDEWWDRDLSDMILRDRNHPSIILWSVGNEIIEVREGMSEGLPIMAAMRDTCHRLDPTRPMTCGCCAIRKTNAAGYGPLMDVVGYNGGGGSCFDYEIDHAAYPDRIIFASEVPHTLQTRGVYRTRTWYRDLATNPEVERIEVPHLTREEVFARFDEHYHSSYDNAMVRISAVDSWRLSRDLPFLCGEFRWSGFDYLGESHAWPAKSWNYGVIDLCGFPKDTYYFYQSQWTAEPMVHILPHWTWPGLEGVTIPIVCYTNCDEAELFLDDVSLGMQKTGSRMYLRWDVPYAPGVVRAVGYRDGEIVADHVHATAGSASTVLLRSAQTQIRGDGTGVAHVEIVIVDEAANLVPHANPELAVEVGGPGFLAGLENGDPIDSSNYQSGRRNAFHGMALAMVQSKERRGTISVSVRADGLESAVFEISSV
jgi:beta-galactosidase